MAVPQSSTEQLFFQSQGRPPKRDIDILQHKLLGIKNEKIRCSLCEYPFSRINLVDYYNFDDIDSVRKLWNCKNPIINSEILICKLCAEILDSYLSTPSSPPPRSCDLEFIVLLANEMKHEKIWTNNTISIGKETEQSSVFNCLSSSNAVTGIPQFGDKYNAITNIEKDPYWQVDLGQNYVINEIIIWNAVNNRKSFIIPEQSFYVFISLKPFGLSSQARRSGMTEIESSKRRCVIFKKCNLNGMKLSVDFPDISGRYVRIQSQGRSQLAFTQVQVKGTINTYTSYSFQTSSSFISNRSSSGRSINGSFKNEDLPWDIRKPLKFGDDEEDGMVIEGTPDPSPIVADSTPVRSNNQDLSNNSTPLRLTPKVHTQLPSLRSNSPIMSPTMRSKMKRNPLISPPRKRDNNDDDA